jgi:hypothetical protein
MVKSIVRTSPGKKVIGFPRTTKKWKEKRRKRRVEKTGVDLVGSEEKKWDEKKKNVSF